MHLSSSCLDSFVIFTVLTSAVAIRLMELPDGIGSLGKTLKHLWLDFNNLTALPMSFHKMEVIEELKMEGNVGMVFPTIDKIIRGPKAVVAWSKKR